ncbi:MAG: MotA/TolQ/ExbB proton channel family protein [Myxococcales bacterium]|nr:MotA/TolQ/ExbB proton channel family protein [Myxococcales bacterium]
MNLTTKLLSVALFGAEWVLWLLIALSVASFAVMIERAWFFSSTKIDFDALLRDLRERLGRKDFAGLRGSLEGLEAIEAQVVVAGLVEVQNGPEAVGEAMRGAKARLKGKLERNLAYLGTLGNNAPFVGLFGTVIGVIKAFHDLASKKGQGPEAVMGSLSEALIATAVGLLVAIPAVVAFNIFQRRVRARMANTDAVAHAILTWIQGEPQGIAKVK